MHKLLNAVTDDEFYQNCELKWVSPHEAFISAFSYGEERFHSFIWDEMSLIMEVNISLALFVLLGVKVDVLTHFVHIFIFFLAVIPIFFSDFRLTGMLRVTNR